jgi:hypothetical protein
VNGIPNDVDLEMMELSQAAHDAENQVCSICEEALNPLDPKWATTVWPPTRQADGSRAHSSGRPGTVYRPSTAQEVADMVGPVHPQLPYHLACLEER